MRPWERSKGGGAAAYPRVLQEVCSSGEIRELGSSPWAIFSLERRKWPRDPKLPEMDERRGFFEAMKNLSLERRPLPFQLWVGLW